MNWKPVMDLVLLALSDPEIIVGTAVLYFIRQYYRDNRAWMIFDLVGFVALSALALLSGGGMTAEFGGVWNALPELWNALPELILVLSAVTVWYFFIDLLVLAWQRARHP